MSEPEVFNRDDVKEFKEKVVQIRRVTKVVKGGKKMGFRVVVVVGDEKSRVGVGTGKSNEVSTAIRKAVESAKKKMIDVKMVGTTLPHPMVGKFGASSVVLKPAPRGTGVIAGGAVRIILELGGIKDVVAKSIGSSNAVNIARATIDGLSKLKDVKIESLRRGIELKIKFVGEEDAALSA
ncbi:MAG: 30S ribosomal protein S5 [Candidatus Margulisiibacteriota bacterium]